MPLILAVEPDRRQAANLAAVLRLRPRMELVIANAAAPALEALGARVPNVLLTSPLLSQHDDAVLSAWMTELGPAAAHVQALTIPILAAEPPPPRKRGVFSRLRRRRAHSPATPEGCEPSHFAEQVGMYLLRAEPEDAPVEEPPVPVVAEAAPAAVAEDLPVVEESPAPVVEEQPLALAAVRPGFADRLRAMAKPCDSIAILRLPAPALAMSRLNAELDEWRLQLLAAPVVPAPAVQPEEEPWVELPIETLAGPLQVVPPPEVFHEPQDEVWVFTVVPEAELPQWHGVQDVQDVRRPRPARKPKPPVRARAPKPLQDEWGFFDPSQCGFSALIAKLDEIAEHEDASEATAETHVRVISY